MDSVNSATFIKKPPSISLEEEALLLTKKILCGRLFLGHYVNVRYVPVLCQYRDVVEISSEEHELHKDLEKIKRKWLNVNEIKWVGITSPQSQHSNCGYSFWVKLSNLPFDYYWFQIKHVKLVEGEILLQLKCIRSAPSTSKSQNHSLKNEEPVPPTSLGSTDSYISTLLLPIQFFNNALSVLLPYINLKTLYSAIRLVIVTVITMVLGTLSCVTSFGDFILRFLREISILIQAISPVIIQLIDFFTKILGGFFILLAWLFGKNNYRRSFEPIVNNNRSMPITFTPKTRPLNWEERNRLLKEQLHFHMKNNYETF